MSPYLWQVEIRRDGLWDRRRLHVETVKTHVYSLARSDRVALRMKVVGEGVFAVDSADGSADGPKARIVRVHWSTLSNESVRKTH